MLFDLDLYRMNDCPNANSCLVEPGHKYSNPVPKKIYVTYTIFARHYEKHFLF